MFDGEPRIHQGYYELENAFLLPHMGSATVETRNAMASRYILSVDPRDSSFYGTRQASRAVMEEILRPLGPDAVSGGLEMQAILPRQEGHD